MTIKTIEYEINLAGITPAEEQFGGTQGDHNVTEIKFLLAQELFDALGLNAADQKIMYRFDVYDGEGGIWQSEPIQLTEKPMSVKLQERHTRFGGKVTVYLVITELSEDNETQIELYSFPAVARLKNRPDGVYQDGENYESVTSLAQKAKNSAVAAEKSNNELQLFAAVIEEKLKNGEFDGLGVESVKIVNNELIITYTNGVIQNLGNVKGDKGDMPDMSNYYTKAEVDNLDAVKYVIQDDETSVSLNSPVGNSYILVNDNGDVDISSEENVRINGSRITLVGNPKEKTDAATKGYVDGLVGNIETLLGGI